MQRRIIFEAVLLILIFASIWGVLSILPIIPEKTPTILARDKEDKLGELLLEHILSGSEFRVIESDTLTEAVKIILTRLTDALESDEYNYSLHILKDDMANAFALPGGNILVTSGLFEITEVPREMAAVIAHEMGHIEEQHVLYRLLKNFTIAILFSDDMLISEASKLILSTTFDRKQEEEADLFALHLLENAMIDPRILGTALRHIGEKSGAYNPSFEIIMSHPDIDSRIKAAYDYEVQVNFTEEAFQIDWDAVKRQTKKDN